MSFHTYIAHLCYRAKYQATEVAPDITGFFRSRFASASKSQNATAPEEKNAITGATYYDPTYMKRAKQANFFAKVTFIILLILFNAIFWIVAITEYVIPAENYIDKEIV